MRIAQDSAHGLVVAICHIRAQDPHYKPPRLIFLSSATVNPRISRNSPWLVHHVVYRALAYAYRDLELAEQFMRLHESWLNATFVQPGALTEDVQKGHALSLDDCPSFVSYLDLAAGMIEIAESGKYEWQGVSVMGTGKDIRFEPKAPKQILRGFLFNFFPWTYPIAQYLSLM